MFEVTKFGKGWALKKYDHVIFMDNLSEVIEVRTAVDKIIDGLAAKAIPTPIDDDAVITTGDALRIAESDGYELPRRTIATALERGNIEAEKNGSRWQINQASFMVWYETWKAMQDRKGEHESSE
ncbi:MAG: hypothetical protein AAF639_44920 [Chloroflexota bacterium]